MLDPGSLVLDGRFRVIRHLSQGGMGEVYLAEQVSLGRRVALKVLRQDLSMQPGMGERFRREAKLLSSVDHPSVVRVIEFGQSEHATCLVMELVEGETLKDALAEGPFPPGRALTVLTQLAEGLAAIHEKGIVHRDLKPENVVLSAGPTGELARLLDFGIARLVEPDRDSNVSQVGVVLGTPEYLSPEQAVGAKLDGRSDLYSLGVLAYRMLSGALPFAGPSPRQFLAQHVSASPQPIQHALPALSGQVELCSLVMRCLEKDPLHRFPNARFLAGALAAIRVVPLDGSESRSTRAGNGLPQASSSGTAAFGAVTVPTPPKAPPITGFTGSGLGPSKAQNLTVMLTDIVGFTQRTSAQTREENARMLEEHDRLLLPLVRSHAGKLVQKRGDALLVAFKSPTESVLCGMAMQDKLWRHNRSIPVAEQLHIRVAIHLGEVLLTRDGLLGEPVQVVAAVEGAAGQDEVVFTEAVNLARTRSEANAEEYGDIEIAGRGEKIKLYRVARAPDGPPFGGLDFHRAGHGLWRRRWLGIAESVIGLPGTVKRWSRAQRWTAAGAGTLVALVASILWASDRGNARQIRELISKRQPEQALALIEQERARDPRSAEALRPLEAAALHQKERHADELQVMKSLSKPTAKTLEPGTLSGLLEDYGREHDGSEVAKWMLSLPKPEIRDQATALARAPSSAAQWGALRYLDDTKQTDGLMLPGLYAADLDLKDCRVKRFAAKRLGELGDASMVARLTQLKEAPHQEALFQADCGQEEAARAIRQIQRKAKR